MDVPVLSSAVVVMQTLADIGWLRCRERFFVVVVVVVVIFNVYFRLP